MWCVYNKPSNKKEFRIEIAKSIPHIGLVLDYGQGCSSKIFCFFDT